MKKKILSLFIVLVAFFAVLFSTRALTAKAPESIPATGTEVYGVVDKDTFNFSKIKFTTSTGDTINGKSDLKKIMLGTNYTDSSVVNGEAPLIDWFTAYCLDPTVSYPDSGYAFQSKLTNNNKTLFEFVVLTALKNQANTNKNMYDLIATLRGLIYSEMEVTVPEEYMDGTSINYDKLIRELISLNFGHVDESYTGPKQIKINISKIVYVSATSTPTITEVTGAQLNEALGKTADAFEMTLSKDHVEFNEYLTTTMSSSKVNYNWALWIIEHSYPNLTMDRMFDDIGVSKDALVQQLITLEGLTDVSETEADALIENYVYGTIQYAVWRSTGSKVDGAILGDELQGSTELNKIYKYLIKERDYSNYGSEKFETKLTLKAPASSDEIAEETKTTIKYGPYSYKSSLLTVEKINVTTTATSGVKIVNLSGEEITSVKDGEEFYVLVDKNHNQTQITINAETVNGYTFEPSSNRGRVYYAHDPLTQTVGTGGIIKAARADYSFDIMINVKTGIANLALVFVLSLLIFSLGYMYIAYRNKPVEL